MAESNDGGFAFPSDGGFEFVNSATSNHMEAKSVFHPGMSMRDFFAAHALASLLATSRHAGEEVPEHVAAMAYVMADAMLAERAKCQK